MFPLHPHDPPSVGPHRLYARLGEDAYARVYLGAAGVEDPVAVKVVRPEYATSPAFRSAFTQQVEAAYGLNSAHVCAVRDADLRGAVPWVAVSRPLGPALADLVRHNGPLPVDALHPLALALAQGLADLHASDRAHGSLWPDGVLLSGRTALLADPGLEWAISDAEQRAPHPAFAAPEGGATPATDVFSWASTLCFAASGVEGPDGLARVPLQLRGLVDTCLKRDPRLRPSADDLVRMLGGPSGPQDWSPPVRAAIDSVADAQRSMLSTAAVTPRASTGDGGPPTRKRGRLMAAGAGVLALVVVAAAGAVFAHNRLGGAADQGRQSQGGEDDGAGALITDAGCLDGTGYPAPEEPLPEDTSFRDPRFSPDGDVLVTASSAGLSVWDWKEGEEVARPAEDSSPLAQPVFSPVGCTVAATRRVEYEGREYPVSVGYTYDLPAGTTTEHLGPQDGPDDSGRWLLKPLDVTGMAFSTDGGLLAVTVSAGYGEDSTVVVDTATGEAGEPMASGVHHGTVFVDDGHFATNDRGEIHVWDAETGEEVHVVQGAVGSSLAVVPGETQVVHLTSDRQIVVRDYTTGEEVASFTREEYETDDDPLLTELLADPARNRVYATWQVTTGEGAWRYSTYVWDTATGENLAEGNENIGKYTALVPHPDGEVLAATTVAESDLVLVDPDTFEVVRELG
ncbi:protein kinase [Nocardiopsis ganjiahuensis]|uniref:protein kinase n=1 Tax=Nocardiopsis ganjiahuensis TaxID=239984 RepID=UPI0003457973|nr:protein kinase [Nocardiopsis ganjiahuensis]